MTLQDKIKELRLTNDYTQNDLADALNISRPTLSRWETGVAEPSASDLKKISNLFNVSVDDLLNDQTDNLEKTTDISKWKNSSIIKILLLGLSFAFTFSRILFDISLILNAKGVYTKVPFYVISNIVKDTMLLVIVFIWIHTLLKKQEDVKCASLAVIEVYLGENIPWFVENIFNVNVNVRGFQFFTPMQTVHAILLNGVLPLVCAISIVTYYKKENYINPSVVVLIYVTRILRGTIGWSRSIYQNRNRLLYFDYDFVVGKIGWLNKVVIFSLFLYCALVLTKERKEKKRDTKLEIK